MTDETHDPSLRSWVESANDGSTDFPIQNLPLGVYESADGPHVATAIGDQLLDLASVASTGMTDECGSDVVDALRGDSLNAVMALGRDAARRLRRRLSAMLRNGAGTEKELQPHLHPRTGATMLLPARIGDYTDFYASIHHATNVGSMFRPDNPLLPNYRWIPIGYHGRASSIVVSGAPVRRPSGQTRPDPESDPRFGPSARLDYEMEVGFFVAGGNSLGSPVPIDRAADRIFGLCLVNDWSARDLQAWEYQPLGPFLAKSFATTISPWVVTLDALEPYRTAAFPRGSDEPRPLDYLVDPEDQERGGLDITVEVWIRSEAMRRQRSEAVRLSRGNFRDMYWTIAQMLAHHTSNGCNLRPGDLLASGTVSGEAPESRGSLLELAWKGSQPVELPGGETRRFLEDGDEVILRGYCQRDGVPRIGFGECRGIVTPA